MARKRKSDPVSVYDMALIWRHSCGHETIKPQEWFKPPYFVCNGCNKTVAFTDDDLEKRVSEQLKRALDSHAKLTEPKK